MYGIVLGLKNTSPISLHFCSPSTMASICVAFRSFCCDSLPLTLSFVIPHLSLPLLRSLHPSRPLMPSSRVGGRGIRADCATVEGRTGEGPTDMDKEILACPGCEEVWGAEGGARLCSVRGRNWPGSTSSGWTIASFTRVWQTRMKKGMTGSKSITAEAADDIWKMRKS